MHADTADKDQCLAARLRGVGALSGVTKKKLYENGCLFSQKLKLNSPSADTVPLFRYSAYRVRGWLFEIYYRF